ncbi:transglutaminase-like domain-containing protein [Polyangium sp. 15x6]|uniref:SirB1 family protein n=1 Tax=Polyangium sp. 15x6 TaxID=3042687 RepID=UPI00249A17F1|nr:transglutaminase-like domain-containing protein [Polyangium sp. 15x6]MDI3284892.1 transglutaminase-like domain-containing protein [Polyangium sp. 15x6]
MVPSRPSLTLFAHLVSRPESEIDLVQAALVFAESEYPSLDVARYVATLEALGRAAARRIAQAAPHGTTEERMRVVLEWLYGSQGFRGNAEEYYDPRNSYLNEVLDRKKGIPITLAVILLDVATRAGIDAKGISFPGHFLVGAGEREKEAPRSALERRAARLGASNVNLVIDPFHGRILGNTELEALHARVTGAGPRVDPRLLEPCSKRQILARMLSNLRSIHASRGDDERLRNVLEHLVAIAPSPELTRELERLGGSRAILARPSAHRSFN